MTATAALQCYDINTVAELLVVNVRTVNRLIADGQLAVLKIRGRTVVTEQALLDYRTRNEVRRSPKRSTA
jgi:excisionase family DNA binding protein